MTADTDTGRRPHESTDYPTALAARADVSAASVAARVTSSPNDAALRTEYRLAPGFVDGILAQLPADLPPHAAADRVRDTLHTVAYTVEGRPLIDYVADEVDNE